MGVLCVFSPEDREKLASELNKQIENGDFYHVIENAQIAPSISEQSIETFKGVGLFRPLVTSNYNPLKSNIYNYKPIEDTKVHGITFANPSSMSSESLLNDAKASGIYTPTSCANYTYIPNAYKEPTLVPIREVAKNTYSITDILQNTSDSDVLSFQSVPKELALTKKNTVKDILFKQIDISGTFKKVFGINHS